MPTLREAFEGSSPPVPSESPARSRSTAGTSTARAPCWSIPWTRPARDVEQCFSRLTAEAGWVPANNAVRMLRSLYRRRCIDIEGLHDPVDQWRATGGRTHRQRSRRIPPPAEVLPCWHRGIETAVRNHVARDAFRFGLYTGMRRDEVLGLRWAQVDMNAMTFNRGDRDRRAAGAARHPAGGGDPRTPPRRARSLFRAVPAVGVSVREQPLWPSPPDAAPERADRRGGRGAVLVQRASHVLHRRGRSTSWSCPAGPDRAAGQQRPAPGCDRGPCGGLDHGATARGRAAHRRPDRRAGADASARDGNWPGPEACATAGRPGWLPPC